MKSKINLLYVLFLFFAVISYGMVTYASRANAVTENRHLKITLNGKETVTATLVESSATEDFLTHLPLTVDMHEHLSRQKEVYLPFSLSRESQRNTVHEYAVGDIVYWHPGPTMGIFHAHDGKSINSGIEVLAKLDEAGVKTFASYPDDVKVTFELETAAGAVPAAARGAQQLDIVLDGTVTVKATLVESPLAKEFVTKLPLTFEMTDYRQREKHAPLSFSLSEGNLTDVRKEYKVGDIIYYPPGPTYAMFYAHDGNVISAGMEVLATLDQEGIKALASFPDDVKVTVTLAK